jgi:4'-phosphopantetheinyl transferase
MKMVASRFDGRAEGRCGLGEWTDAPGCLVWRRIDLDDDGWQDSPCVLAADEIERASRFAFARDRSRYVAGRTALRLSLAEVVGMRPERIRLAYGPNGKPRLAEDDNWHFNVTHSDGIGLIVIGNAKRVGEVGVDVEHIKEVADLQMLAASSFSPQECHALENRPVDMRSRAFLACWTRKEACVKALGTGLTTPTCDFHVGITDPCFATFIEHDGVALRLEGCEIPAGRDCVAAIAWRSAATGIPVHEGHRLRHHSGPCLDLES